MSTAINKIKLYLPLIKSLQTGLLLATGVAGYLSARIPPFNIPELIGMIFSLNGRGECFLRFSAQARPIVAGIVRGRGRFERERPKDDRGDRLRHRDRAPKATHLD